MRIHDTDPKQIPLSRWYALLLGPIVGAATGLSAFLQNDADFAMIMVLLFAGIGAVAGGFIFVYDWWRDPSRKKTSTTKTER